MYLDKGKDKVYYNIERLLIKTSSKASAAALRRR